MTQSNFKVAITGGIGSGKSCVAEIIRGEGYAVFSCDGIYAELLKDKSFSNKLVESFGDILNGNGEVDRKKLSAIVFADREKLKLLNELTHPTIIGEAIRRMEDYRLSFCEVPLLFENGYENYFDEVIVVLRNEANRLASILQRDKISQKEAEERIKSQFDYNNCSFARYCVTHNNGNLSDLRVKTLEILKNIENKIY